MSAERIEKISRGRCIVSGIPGTSGDTAVCTHLPDGSLAFILSDGLGKGPRAHRESRLVIETLRKLLKEGTPAAAAIKAVNREMIESRREGDSFATVDLTIIDPRSGRVRFYKMGAATSFLVRDGCARRVEHPALPVGILPKLKLRVVSASLRPGDVIVMASDGVTEADRRDLSARWLEDYLRQLPAGTPPTRAAEEIVCMALKKYGRREKDDLSALVITIE